MREGQKGGTIVEVPHYYNVQEALPLRLVVDRPWGMIILPPVGHPYKDWLASSPVHGTQCAPPSRSIIR